MLNKKLSRVHFLFALPYTIFGAMLGIAAISRYINNGDVFLLMYSAILLAIASIHWFAMYFSKRGNKYGKAISIFVAIPMLIGVPLGTMIGIYIIRKANSFELENN